MVDQSKEDISFWLQESKGRCHGNQILAKVGKRLQNGHNFSCVQHIQAEFRDWI